MASMLTSLDEGEYFTEAGEIRRDLPVDYVKARTWELRPRVKVPQGEQVSGFVAEQGASTEEPAGMDGVSGMRGRAAQL